MTRSVHRLLCVCLLALAIATPAFAQAITDAQFASLQAIRATYPETLTPEQIGALLNEWTWQHRGDGLTSGLGMQRKESGTAAIQPKTGTHVWNGVRFIVGGQHFGQDVLSGASIGKATPVRGQTGPADPKTFVAPIDPGSRIPDPPPPPPPTSGAATAELQQQQLALLLQIIGKLDAQLEAQRLQTAGLAAAVQDLKAQIAAGIKIRF